MAFASKEWVVDLLNKSFKKKDETSEDEKTVGTWIDGSKIYEKTVVIAITNNTNYTMSKATIDSEFGTLIGVSGYALVDSGNTFATVPCYYTSAAFIGIWARTNVDEIHLVSGSQYATRTLYLTFRYTKTTS